MEMEGKETSAREESQQASAEDVRDEGEAGENPSDGGSVTSSRRISSGVGATSTLGKRSSGDVGSGADVAEHEAERSSRRLKVSEDLLKDEDDEELTASPGVFLERAMEEEVVTVGMLGGDLQGVVERRVFNVINGEERVRGPQGAAGDGGSQRRSLGGEFNQERGTDRSVVLPPSLMESVTVLERDMEAGGGKALVYVLGTSHMSQESCKDVRLLIRLVKPEVVFVEVCRDRVGLLTPHQKLQVPTFLEVLQQLRAKNSNAFCVLYRSFVAKVAAKMDVLPGGEFRAAYEEAKDLQAELELGDRPVQITLQRIWGRMSRWEKLKLVWALMRELFSLPDADELALMMETLKDSDVLMLIIQAFGNEFPVLAETVINERDQYMAATLHEAARQVQAVVAVVGKGHRKGIEENWGKPIDVEALLTVPQHKARSSWCLLSPVSFLVLSAAVGGAAIYMGSRFLRGSR